MSSRALHSIIIIAGVFFVLPFLSATMLWASVSGSISDTVKDASGRVVVNAHVIAMESNTGLTHEAHTDSKGYYTFPVFSVGHCVLHVEATGFGKHERREIVLDTNAALSLDASLAVGNVSENVTVTDNTLHVETVSTQLGQAITGRRMTAVPLDYRGYTDLLSLQPGVVPVNTVRIAVKPVSNGDRAKATAGSRISRVSRVRLGRDRSETFEFAQRTASCD